MNKIKNIGIMSPGAMGQAFALQFKARGFAVLSALDQRSARTRALAEAAGVTDVGSLERLVHECDVILSIMDPGGALAFAHDLALAVQTARTSPLIVDCNAIAPATMHAIFQKISDAGARCADGGIMGPPPAPQVKSRLYLSGPQAHTLTQLATPQLSIHVMSERIGDASALKMCDAVMSKGVTALLLQMLLVARRLGIEDALDEQCQGPRRYFHDWIIATLPIMPPKAYRWVPELAEIAKTFDDAGVCGDMMRAAIHVYEQIAQTPLGREAPEQRDLSRSGQDVARMLAQAMKV